MRKLLLPGVLGAALSACAPPSIPAPRPADPPPSEPIPAFQETVTRLQPAEAARLAREARAASAATAAEGLELSLWAPEPLIADPIALSVDSLGRLFVTRTARTDRAEIDIRQHRDWMVPSITFRTVEDKRRFYLSELAPERSARNEWLEDYNRDGSRDWRDLTVHRERIHRIEDTDGDGVADLSAVVFEGLDQVVSDVAHGVLAEQGGLLLTASPDLWRLRDTDGDGTMDTRQSLARGFGVHIGFGGHGLSGPVIGPDGRLYWKMGDLGFDLTTREGRRLSNPHSGAILRSEPDGSDIEVFATGLRNPQEFAFDAYGNLITADNDGDHPGETERLVYVTEGSDTGWRIHWQFGKYVDPDNNAYKVWMDEGMYRPRFEGQAAWFVPPVAAYHAGPSGVAYNPGTALGERWRDYFFVSVFPGSAAGARVHGFRLREKGATFELADDQVVARGVLAVGMKFGPDGALYMADWIEGWAPKERGRVWRLDAPAEAGSALRAETRRLIAESFAARPTAELVGLLRHADMRVRTKAQFALVDRRASAELLAAARGTDHRLARLHALWGIGQLARRDAREARPLAGFLGDADAEVRAQAVKVIGDLRHAPAAGMLVPLLRDPAPRVRFFAAEALGRIGHRPAAPAIVAMLEANDDADVQLRHAGSLALARLGDAAAAAALAEHRSRAVRVAAVVALRRMRDPGVARFLGDADEYVVAEAARAINDDESIEAALPSLAAALEETRFTSEPLLRRAVNANLRLGGAAEARRVAGYAARAGAPEGMRAEAVAALGVWPRPSILDRVDGSPRDTLQRDSAVARAAVAAIVEPVFAGAPASVQVALAGTIGRLRLREAAPALHARVRSGTPAELRVAALRALHEMGDAGAGEATRAALQDPEPVVRMAAIELVPTLGLSQGATTEMLWLALERGSGAEVQVALSTLGRVGGEAAREVLARLVERLAGGSLPGEIQIEVVEAARASDDATLRARIDAFERERAAGPPRVAYADALRGGNAGRGRTIVAQHPAAQCTRCHAIGTATAGAEVGPNLAGIGERLTREELLEALVHPNGRIAPGFGAPSAMPPMGGVLSRRELRDVVEYLSTLR